MRSLGSGAVEAYVLDAKFVGGFLPQQAESQTTDIRHNRSANKSLLFLGHPKQVEAEVVPPLA